MDQETGNCIRCGRRTANQMGNIWVCEECYQIRGSCCPEFGGDDLTQIDERSSTRLSRINLSNSDE